MQLKTRTERTNQQLAPRPSEADRVERRSSARGEAKVFVGIRGALRIGEVSFRDFGGTFPEDSPRPRAVNRLAIDRQPAADLQENPLILFGNRAVGFGADVQQKRAVLADDVG